MHADRRVHLGSSMVLEDEEEPMCIQINGLNHNYFSVFFAEAVYLLRWMAACLLLMWVGCMLRELGSGVLLFRYSRYCDLRRAL